MLSGYTDSGESEISTESFFLAENGMTNPGEELLATLSAFARPAMPDDPDQHPQCLYRARYLFLVKQFDLAGYGIRSQPCPGFLKFIYDGEITGLSLVFATGYFGNPASYYGHFLLKLNTDNPTIEDLEKTTINFGAVYPPDENMLIYIFKGIFGGYDSVYKPQQYFEQSLNYGEVDLRDVWEYELNYTKEEVRLLAAHLWELLNVKYDYYFFNRNCAYRMATVFELVLKTKLTDADRLWQIPQHVIQQLSSTSHHGASLVRKVNYIPSRQSRLYQRYLNLTVSERDFLGRIIFQPEMINTNNFDELPLRSRLRLLDAMLDYYQYLIITKYAEQKIIEGQYRTVLSKRFELPPGVSAMVFKSRESPHLGRRPSYLQAGVVDVDGQIKSSIKIRPAYYDSLDYSNGHIRNSTLVMGELELIADDEDWYVESLSIIRIENIQRNVTNLPGDNTHSWYLGSGFVNNQDGCKDCLDFEISGGIGLSGTLANDKLVVSGFIGGGFEDNRLRNEGIYASGRILIHLNMSSATRLRLESKSDYFIEKQNKRTKYTLEGRQTLTTNSDLRIQLEKADTTEVKISYGFYW